VITPWKPPPPVPRNLPFHPLSGSQTSILMLESELGVRVAVTRQKGGSPVIAVGGLEPGTTNTPVVLSAAELIVVCCSCNNWRLVHGVAIAGVLAIATPANRAIAAPTR
jgi:hypothetical protein